MLRPASLLAPILLVACASAPPPAPPPAPTAPAPTTPAPSAPPTPEQALTRLFSAERAAEAWFSADFLAAVPIAKIDAVIRDVRADGGAFKGARAEGKPFTFTLTFERGAWESTAKVDAEGRFTTLFVRPAEPKTATVEEALQAFRALPGKVGVVLVTDDAERGAIEPDARLGVGSTFKLAILAALRAEVEGKKRSWKDVVELDAAHRSLPSGRLQDWPDHAPLTLYSLAALMISLSDNTATNTLLGVVGREKVEALAPSNRPFLMTREMFQLKGPGGGDALEAWRKGGEAERRKVLAGLAAKPLPTAESYPTEPTALDLEWFFSARELCGLMKKVHDLPLMAINPGPARKADWDTVAYKGGSEPGVLSMTHWLVKGGRRHCLSATWNAPQKLREEAFLAAYKKAILALRQ